MNQDDFSARIQRLTQHIVERGSDIQREIRELAQSALREPDISATRLKNIANAVAEGVRAANEAPPSSPPEQTPLAQALRGLEDALRASAEAMKLALQEAASRTRDVTLDELRRGKDELAALQSLFTEVVKNTTQGTRQSTHHTWDDFARHVAGNATRLSARAADIGAQLQRYIEQSLREGPDKLTHALDALANTAADALDRFGEALRRGEVHKKD